MVTLPQFRVDILHENEHNFDTNEDIAQDGGTTSNEDKDFFELAKDREQPLYEGLILELLQDAFENANLPTLFYEAKKTISKLGLDYEKIHACPNNYMLYWGVDDENMQICKVCKMSRWKPRATGGQDLQSDGRKSKNNVPAKVIRYFPLKPRLQRLFLSSKTVEDMRWHAMDDNNYGIMRHPRDSEAWKRFDLINTEFASDPRNVRLRLATDGFNPFGNMSSNYSTWPIVLVPYNTPPWVCMMSTSFIMSTIIPGKRMPGNDIDVYLQPLMKELKELWHNGVDAYDSFTREMFKLHAALMWTISDFPGLRTLSGWNTYTGLACPTCNFDSIPCRLPHRPHFNGKQELRESPKVLSGTDILQQVKNVHVTFGRKQKLGGKGKRRRGSGRVTQNVCDNIIYTLLNDSAKSKDHINARKDLKEWDCKPDLWPDANDRYPPTIYTMTNEGKKAFLNTLKNITVPDGYASNISRCIDVEPLRLNGMLKSHDCHILMHQLLPLAMRTALPEQVSRNLIELCSFFKQICSKVLSITNLERLQNEIVLTLCHMEMLFPPSFFTVMVHLVVHLVDEAKHGGPAHYRGMYPIERYLGQLKSYVKNKARPEGSIAEGYLMKEILTFCSRYLDDIETRFNRPDRVDDAPNQKLPKTRVHESFPQVGKPVGGSLYFNLTPMEMLQAHRHVLINCSTVDPYLQEFRTEVRRQVRPRTRNPAHIDKKVHREFVEWFSKRIVRDVDLLSESDKDIMLFLGRGPISQARRFNAYNVNGCKFRTLTRDRGLKTQHSGVFGTFGTRSYSSNSDSQMRFGDVLYYGKLMDIIEINYNCLFTVTLFKCQWANTTNPRGIKKDNMGFTSINFTRLIHTGEHEDDEPYIKASEAQKVYFVDDEKEKGWTIPIHLKPRDSYDMGEDEEDIMPSIESYPSKTWNKYCLINQIQFQHNVEKGSAFALGLLAIKRLNDSFVEESVVDLMDEESFRLSCLESSIGIRNSSPNINISSTQQCQKEGLASPLDDFFHG
ncbi:uncharacterized protein LOC133304904 [Gastrolobium bilobum]|uniref:uncharacterized protein LOC133304904 n=1 Tax=Gastrolobium bilobum TaxID=150636 RepID=UPI002AAF7E14|nr:uncharacterized protein LOC133304904 [Gastrolobium bilobum]